MASFKILELLPNDRMLVEVKTKYSDLDGHGNLNGTDVWDMPLPRLVEFDDDDNPVDCGPNTSKDAVSEFITEEIARFEAESDKLRKNKLELK